MLASRKLPEFSLQMTTLKVLFWVRLEISKFNEMKTFSPTKYCEYFKLPRIGPFSQFLAENISPSIVHFFNFVVVRITFSTRSDFLSARKDILPPLQTKLKCLCDADYVLKTLQRLGGGNCSTCARSYRLAYVINIWALTDTWVCHWRIFIKYGCQ